MCMQELALPLSSWRAHFPNAAHGWRRERGLAGAAASAAVISGRIRG
jgi:hypothetical protein